MGNEQGKEKGQKGAKGEPSKQASYVEEEEDDDEDEESEEEHSPEVMATIKSLGSTTDHLNHHQQQQQQQQQQPGKAPPPATKAASRGMPPAPPKQGASKAGPAPLPVPKKAPAPTQQKSARRSLVPAPKASSDDSVKSFCKKHELTLIPYVDLVDLRTALENDQPAIAEAIMRKCRLTPASRPYHQLAFSRLEQNFNTILHFVILHSSTNCFELLQRASEWDSTGTWKDEYLDDALALPNRHGITPRHKIVQMLSNALQSLPPNFRDEMAGNEDTKTIVPGASMAMAQLSDDSAPRTREALFVLMKRAFDFFVHLRAVRTNHNLLLERHGSVANHNRANVPEDASLGGGDFSEDDAAEEEEEEEETEEAKEARIKRQKMDAALVKAREEKEKEDKTIAEEIAHTRELLQAKGYDGAWLKSLRQPQANPSGGAHDDDDDDDAEQKE